MTISEEEFIKIADLAKIYIKKTEINKYQESVKDILEFVKEIKNIDMSEVEDSEEEIVNIFREDEVKEFDNKEGLFNNAISKENNMFKIPKVF